MVFRLSLIIIGFVCTLYFSVLVPMECADRCVDTHERIIANEYTSPWVYRVLTPFTAEALIQNNIAANVYQAYAILHLFLIPVTLLTLYEWLSLSTTPVRAFGACMMFAFFLPLIFVTNYGIGAWSMAEVFFLCLSFIVLQKPIQRNIKLIVIISITVIAALNRSSAILIPLAFSILYFERDKLLDKRWILESSLGIGICLATLMFVRIWRGDATPMIVFPSNISYSVGEIGATTIVNNLFLLRFG